MAKQYGAEPSRAESAQPAGFVITPGAEKVPSAQEVSRIHQKADTDVRDESIHHTLGSAPGQASPGNHTHDGSNSALILEGVTLVGSKSAQPPTAVLSSIVQALVRLGARDNTS